MEVVLTMTEGTKSYLIGCHQFFLHPLWVLMAWRLEYKSWPAWWELICILFHDIGICGRQYLSDDKAKDGHWYLGAHYASDLLWMFNRRSSLHIAAYKMCGGHSPLESNFPKSKLFRADKRARIVMPTWMMWPEYWIEIKKAGGVNPPEWRKVLKKKLASGEIFNGHELYIETRKGETP